MPVIRQMARKGGVHVERKVQDSEKAGRGRLWPDLSGAGQKARQALGDEGVEAGGWQGARLGGGIPDPAGTGQSLLPPPCGMLSGGRKTVSGDGLGTGADAGEKTHSKWSSGLERGSRLCAPALWSAGKTAWGNPCRSAPGSEAVKHHPHTGWSPADRFRECRSGG